MCSEHKHAVPRVYITDPVKSMTWNAYDCLECWMEWLSFHHDTPVKAGWLSHVIALVLARGGQGVVI